LHTFVTILVGLILAGCAVLLIFGVGMRIQQKKKRKRLGLDSATYSELFPDSGGPVDSSHHSDSGSHDAGWDCGGHH